MVVGSGFTLGVMDCFSARPRAYDAIAETEVFAYRQDMERFLVILESHHDLAMDFIALLARSRLAR